MIMIIIIRFSISNEHALDWTVSIHSQEELTALPPFVNRLVFVDDGCNELGFTELDFSSFTHLKKIEVGSNSLLHVNRLTMNGLNQLTEVSIGEGSLNSTRELTIGSNSLNHVQTVELKNLNSLVRVSIGSNSLQDCLGLMMYSLPSLVAIEIGSNTFPISSVFNINSELPALESLVIGSGCFQGNSSVISSISASTLQFNLHSLSALRELFLGDGSFPFFKQFNMNGRKVFSLCI